jgi:hypothetical protein
MNTATLVWADDNSIIFSRPSVTPPAFKKHNHGG